MEKLCNEIKTLDPKECAHASPYMVDNGILDLYHCERFSVNCYHEPNGGKQFKKVCERKPDVTE